MHGTGAYAPLFFLFNSDKSKFSQRLTEKNSRVFNLNLMHCLFLLSVPCKLLFNTHANQQVYIVHLLHEKHCFKDPTYINS